LLIAAFAFVEATASAKPALVEQKKPTAVFPGRNQLTLTWTNLDSEQFDAEITGKVFQESSKLAMPLPVEVKTRLQLLPNQTALAQVAVDVPELREKSSLLIRWQDASQVIGKTELTVYSRNMLHELETLAGDKGIGVESSDANFKAAFKNARVKFEDIDKAEIHSFDGRILIATDCPKKTALSIAKRGIVVISIVQPEANDPLKPNFFAIPNGRGVVVLVQGDFIENFDMNPESQLRLIQICRMATKPGHPELPVIFSKEQNEN
jgi:hypothetical protein